MLALRKLTLALFLFTGLAGQSLLAADLRYYLILQGKGDQSFDYIGSVTINDDIQALAAQIFFPGGDVILEMDILPDGQTVNLQVNPNGRTFYIMPSSTPITSSYARALQSGSGSPSDWFANPGLTTHQFRLPEIPLGDRILLSRRVQNDIEDIKIRFNRSRLAQIQNMRYSQEELHLNPGMQTSGRFRSFVNRMNDKYLFKLLELMVVALVSPQLVRGSHFASDVKRDFNDPGQKLPLAIDVSEGDWLDKSCRRRTKRRGTVDPAQGYMLWIWENYQWIQHYITEAIPQAFLSSLDRGYGVIGTPQGPRTCFVEPAAYTGNSDVDQALRESGGKNAGTPPRHCRDGRTGWPGDGAFGGGPGSGWGGGSSGSMAH